VRVDELRVLEADELGMRLRTARRELYELRFKHAVGQLDNSSQIVKVRHDLARIMTVLRERDLGLGPTIEEAQQAQSALAGETAAIAAAQANTEAEEAEPKPKRGRRAKKAEPEEEPEEETQ
jgi:large subunit ribosomal protein L29